MRRDDSGCSIYLNLGFDLDSKLGIFRFEIGLQFVGVTDRGLVPRSIKKVVILGGGSMGSGIATTLIVSNYPIILIEVDENSLQTGIGRVKANLQSRVEKGTKSSDRIVGAHFFSPADVIPLLEIARIEKTSIQVIVDLIDVGKNIGKILVVDGNDPGFVVNRMFFPYTQAAILLAEHGADIYQIDQLSTISDKEIIEMILFPIVNEACQVYATVNLDIAGVMVMGFLAYRGRVMFWADFIGSEYICSRLEE